MVTNYEQFKWLLNPQPRIYNLFISHSWDYGDDRTNLGTLIVQGLGSRYIYDLSAPIDDPIHAKTDSELTQALIKRISDSKVLIFPAGMYASHSKWIPVEISIAQQLNTPIIAVEKWGSQRSSSMITAADEIVGWSSKSIANAINRWHPIQYAN